MKIIVPVAGKIIDRSDVFLFPFYHKYYLIDYLFEDNINNM